MSEKSCRSDFSKTGEGMTDYLFVCSQESFEDTLRTGVIGFNDWVNTCIKTALNVKWETGCFST
jgi:hypothetical protein